MPRSVPFRRTLAALLLSCALVAGATACGDSGDTSGGNAASVSAAASPSVSVSASAEKQRLAKTRFVANAGLAAGATYQWIVKPYRAGTFKKGAEGRRLALVKAGLAGGFAYNRLQAAAKNAKGDPLLSKAVAPLTAGIESLKGLGTKLRKGEAGEGDVGAFESVIDSIKNAGKDAGAEVKDKVPSTSQLTG
ncbi:hypothetical protein AMK14_13390 [Streptomyces sp. TSRI0445]|uniref:Uncharacterized protein n=1 Tax=Streptomyces globisporus TaxID=1908 RepID=A0ABM9GSP4_STRGL|nr:MULTISPECIES: hypothetical protein [Streptomyces]PPA42614.1 hypothetical protein BF14_024820 [Streptomyces griseus]RAN19899.1 hypothetical protein A3838_24255 [Streptomyces badius]AWL88712.1 hypothetical protein DIJ69_24860 [Streptomyces globisporus]OKI70188.1 hypothetical protein AMK14_13390 [Streptomyces sp. TSRI0445]RAN27821.1 hypothetical protein A3800_24275 [Streptomyces badius]